MGELGGVYRQEGGSGRVWMKGCRENWTLGFGVSPDVDGPQATKKVHD